MEGQLFNKAELIFSNRFRAATKGSTRPEICAMDWNWNCKSKSAPFDGMVALSSAKLTRVFGLNGNAWKMLVSIQFTDFFLSNVHPPISSIFLILLNMHR